METVKEKKDREIKKPNLKNTNKSKEKKQDNLIKKNKNKKNKRLTLKKIIKILKAEKPKEKVVFNSIEEVVDIIKKSKPGSVILNEIKPEIEKVISDNVTHFKHLKSVNEEILSVSKKTGEDQITAIEEIKKEIDKLHKETNLQVITLNKNQELMVETKKDVESIIHEQKKLSEEIKTIKSNKPSEDLISFLKLYKYDIKSVFKFERDEKLNSIIKDMTSEDYKKNLKMIPKSNNEKLKSDLKLYKGLLNPKFIAETKEKKDLKFNDDTNLYFIINNLASFVSSVKHFIPEEKKPITKES